jgi:hypothetical protein
MEEPSQRADIVVDAADNDECGARSEQAQQVRFARAPGQTIMADMHELFPSSAVLPWQRWRKPAA